MVFYLGENSKDGINLQGHVNLDKEAAKHIGQGINTIGSQIGLAGTITGVSTAVAKGITKSFMPPLQKAAIIVASGLIIGLGHSIISNVNRKNIWEENSSNVSTGIINNNNNNNINSNINKFVDDNVISSPLENLLFDIEALNYICLSLVIILIIQIGFKFFFPQNVILNLSKIFGIKINKNLEYYINKIIKLNKNMSNIYI
jgi:hypothetical protein